MWTKEDRFLAILSGNLADHPPVSVWRHFFELEHGTPQVFAQAMLQFQEKYDWDYVKLQPRATYYEEAWGSEFDHRDYQGGFTGKRIKTAINSVQDLETIVELSGTSGPFAEQLAALEIIRQGIQDGTPIFQTIFCPATVFQKLCGIDSIGRYRPATRSDLMVTLFHDYPDLVHKALKNITSTLANYSQEIINRGIFGIFYASTGLSRAGYLNEDEWREFVQPYDLDLLEECKPLQVMLHTCGIHSHPEWFVDYPISILHWAESAPGNPPLFGSEKWLNGKTPMGGIDERLFGRKRTDEIAQATRVTLQKMRNVAFIMAPECSVDQNTSHEELMTFRNAVLEGL